MNIPLVLTLIVVVVLFGFLCHLLNDHL